MLPAVCKNRDLEAYYPSAIILYIVNSCCSLNWVQALLLTPFTCVHVSFIVFLSIQLYLCLCAHD